jgi:MFS family permease
MKREQSIVDQRHVVLTLGILLLTAMSALETLAVTTIASTIAKELGGIALYSWIFSASLLAQMVGTVVAGQWADQRGIRNPFLTSLGTFAVGILVASLASNMPIFIVARALQGLGAGGLLNSVYTSINLNYDDRLRSRMLAVVSSAYILPAILGPYVAGFIAQQLTWRLVFWALLPLLLVAGMLVLPAFWHQIRQGKPVGYQRLVAVGKLAAGTGCLLAGLDLLPTFIGILLAVLGVVVAIFPLRLVLLSEKLQVQCGFSLALVARGLFTATYFGTESFLVLALTSLKGYRADTAGLVVASAALTWFGGTWLQARLDKRPSKQERSRRMVIGITFMLAGVCLLQSFLWLPGFIFPLLIALTGHMLAGFGIGLAEPASGTILLAYAPDGEEGRISSSIQIMDVLLPAVSIGLGGALVSTGRTAHLQVSIGIAAALGLHMFLVMLSLFTSYYVLRIHRAACC